MRHTVLVIDDQWSMQEMARIVLQHAGYRVLVAGDCVTGLSLARTEHPDVIIMDQRMPDMDGTDILQGLRQDQRTADIPVILITVPAVEGAMPGEPSTDADNKLQKPFLPPALLLMVEHTIKRANTTLAV